MSIINDELLKAIMPASSAKNRAKFLPYLEPYMKKFGIVTRNQINAFLAQIAHESGSLAYVEEIASGAAYEGRKDLGNTQKGDGVRFKGRGLIQITGRANYTAVAKALNIDCINNPELLETPEYAVAASCWWWSNAKLNSVIS